MNQVHNRQGSTTQQSVNVSHSNANLPPFYRQSTQNFSILSSHQKALKESQTSLDNKTEENFNSINMKTQVVGSAQKCITPTNGLQNSHSKILTNLSKNFQEFKEDLKQLKSSIGQEEAKVESASAPQKPPQTKNHNRTSSLGICR